MEGISDEIANKTGRNDSEIRPILKRVSHFIRVQAVLHFQERIERACDMEDNQLIWVQKQSVPQRRASDHCQHFIDTASPHIVCALSVLNHFFPFGQQYFRTCAYELLSTLVAARN